jgi:regulator of sirC expression with transglutaminase-like and TPR domain
LTDNLKNSELSALISLLDDPSSQIFDKIRGKILHYGAEAIPYLEATWDNSFSQEIQQRVGEIIHTIRISDLKNEFQKWKENDRRNLLKGFCLATKFQYPEINFLIIEEKVEKIRKDIWLELNNNLTALEKIKVMNHIFFEVYRFTGNKINIESSQNLFITNVLEARKGNHLTLGILYIILAQKLEIPVYGVDLPQHFILAYADEIEEGKTAVPNENEILFYINPFNNGAVFTRREIELFLKHLKLKPDPEYYKSCDNATIIKRLVEAMILSYNKQGQPEKAIELKHIAEPLLTTSKS